MGQLMAADHEGKMLRSINREFRRGSGPFSSGVVKLQEKESKWKSGM